jgi:Lar family restriction alleviation protein
MKTQLTQKALTAGEMLQCPFCGYEDAYIHLNDSFGHQLFKGFCDRCFACGPEASKKEDAITGWNSRITDQQR